jgi:hypothetical protein
LYHCELAIKILKRRKKRERKSWSFANNELSLSKMGKEKRAEELVITNNGLAYQIKKKVKQS